MRGKEVGASVLQPWGTESCLEVACPPARALRGNTAWLPRGVSP